MKTLFERVFNGSDQMFAKAEEEVNKIVAEVGRDAPLTMPSTAYCLACIYAYIGKKVTTVGFLQVIPGSLHRVPNFTCWLLRIGVALVAGLNPTSHDTS